MSPLRLAILLLALALAACGRPASIEIPASSPASPKAAEAPAPDAAKGITPGVSGAPAATPAPQHSMDQMGNMNMDHMSMPKDSGTTGGAETKQPATSEALYTCPMHPQVVRSEPGKCPICGMTLEPKKK